jgi:hypothetical protein
VIRFLRLTTALFVLILLLNTALFAFRPQTPHSMLSFLRRANQALLVSIVKDLQVPAEIAATGQSRREAITDYPWSDAANASLYSLNPQTQQLLPLIENALPGTVPVWSPDGALLAASLALPGSDLPASQSEPIPALYLIDLATGERELLWAGIAGQLGWSPEGDFLAFELVSRVGNDRSIWLYERATGAVYTVTEPGIQETSPAWVRYRGRPFVGALLLALDAALSVILWMTRKNRSSRI